jgi:pyruvate dehydrogenase E2 component (dihydrolipoamide acetyltransferase)/2-oxoglutarate dehydrogenase E2 component (dihydrolipoamide succinyltransferase)
MAVEVNIPKLGMSMKEATLTEWKFNEGDKINAGDVVLVIETDKTTWEVEAPASGFLHILVAIDNTEPVGAVVGKIAETPEELAALQKESGTSPTVAAAPEKAVAVTSEASAAQAPGTGERIKVSPVAKKMAEEQGIDLNRVKGTGPGGRITKQDVEEAIAAKASAPPKAVEVSAPPVAAPAADAVKERNGIRIKEIVKLRGMRKAIADHMVQSLTVAAQLTALSELEVTGLKKFREELIANEKELGVRISYTDIYVKAAAKILKEIPMVNASVIDNEIILWEDINIGVAVALQGADVLGGGLIVPVIRNADKKSLTEISLELKNTVQKAREGNLLPDDVSGGTFTITSMGGMGGGWGFGTPIINQPQSAILQPGGIMDRPVVKDGEIVIRPMMPCSFTFDHRVLDGVPAGMFMGRFAQILQNPILLV